MDSIFLVGFIAAMIRLAWKVWLPPPGSGLVCDTFAMSPAASADSLISSLRYLMARSLTPKSLPCFASLMVSVISKEGDHPMCLNTFAIRAGSLNDRTTSVISSGDILLLG